MQTFKTDFYTMKTSEYTKKRVSGAAGQEQIGSGLVKRAEVTPRLVFVVVNEVDNI